MKAETAAGSTTNLIRLEIIRNKLTAIADEMALTLQRTAYSTNIKTRLDFSCAMFDRLGRAIAQSFSQPIHLGSLVHFVPQIVAGYGVDRLRPGDGIICNDGFRGGVHLNDVCLVGPVFHREELVGFVAALAHHVDVGGATPGSLTGLSKEVFAEGLRMPPIRLVSAGTLDDDIFRLIENNIRAPKETGGDIRAQIASINTGARRLGELYEKNGVQAVDALTEELLAYTARRTKHEIRKIPAGTYSAVGYMDGDGLSDESFQVTVTITVGDGDVIFDLTGSDRQRKGPVNATYAMTLSNCAYPLRALIDPDLPVNDGFYRAITVIAPPGTVANAQPPAAIGGGWETALRICETAFQAFGQAMPERIAAGSKGCLCNIAFGGISPRSGQYYVFYEAQGGGYGARATKDGIDAVQAHGQNTENAPIEETEANYPVTIPRYELIPDSEGAGQFRGGLGLRRDYTFNHEVVFSVLSDRAKFPPWGFAGGQSARSARYILNPETQSREFGSKMSLELQPGDVFSVQIGGGGGYGPPWKREPAKLLQDVMCERISPERARSAYGVVIDPIAGTIDQAATTAEREGMCREGAGGMQGTND